MVRRIFLAALLALGLTVLGMAQEKKDEDGGRLSGFVRSVDKSTMTITINMRRDPNIQRMIVYDGSTKFTYAGKDATADEIKEGRSIVAIGKFDQKSAKLMATQVALTERR